MSLANPPARLPVAASRRIALTAALIALGLPLPLSAQNSKPASQEVTALMAGYQAEFGKAKEPFDKVLMAEATKIVARIVAAGDATGAKRIGSQVEDKKAGRAVPNVDPELVKLFALYDGAVTTAAKPVRTKYQQRVEALLQSPAGKEMGTLIALAEAKKVIAGEMPTSTESPVSAPSSATITSFARGRKILADIVEGKTWAFETSSGTDLLSFEKRGKLRWLRAGGNNPGVSENTWEAEMDTVEVGNQAYQIRFDASGTFGEIVFASSKNRYRLIPSTQTIPSR